MNCIKAVTWSPWQVFLIIQHVPLVRLLAWIILAGDTEVFTERGATLYTSSPRYWDKRPLLVALVFSCPTFPYCTYFPRKRGLVKPSFMAPPEPLDKSLAKTLVADR